MFYDKTILDTSKSKEISDIFDSDEPIGLERLFYEQVPFTDFFVYDQMYYETKNAEAFINNKAIKVKEIGRLLVMPELLEILRNNINMEMQPSLNEDMQELLIQIRDSNGMNINKVNNANSDDSINSDLIKAIINKSDVSIYSIGENGDTFREWPDPKTPSSNVDKLFEEKENSDKDKKNYSSYNTTPNTPFYKGNVRHFSTFTRSLSIESKEPNTNSTSYSKDVNEFLKINDIKPVYVYENLGDKYIQSKVLNDTKNLAGVYLILNKFNLSCYVGSASTGKFNSRFRRHLFTFNGSKVVKAAVKKYKIDNFSFIILNIFTEEVNKENNRQLLDMEDYYIKSLLPDYNIVTEAGNTFGYKHSEITRLKMIQSYSPERRLWIGNLNKNKPMSEQHKENMRQAALIRVKPAYSEEALDNMRLNSKPIIVYNLDKTVYGEYSSITEGAKSLRCATKTVQRALNTPKQILRRRWIVKFVKK